MISLNIYPKFNGRNYTWWTVCRYPNYTSLILSFTFICTYVLHVYILIKKIKQDGKKSVPNIAPPCFFLQIPLAYPKWSVTISFHALLICIHTHTHTNTHTELCTISNMCSAAHHGCWSLTTCPTGRSPVVHRPLPVSSRVATTFSVFARENARDWVHCALTVGVQA